MTTSKNIFLIILFLVLSSSCSKKNQTITVLNDPANFKHIVFYNNDRLAEDTKSWEISKEDFTLIDSLLGSESLMSATETVNDSEPFKRKIHESLSNNYYKQYIPYIKNGDRLVYMNAFCVPHKNWKENFVHPLRDGGNCYWNVKVNLDKKTMTEYSQEADSP